jgi:hypothetical protein
MSGFPQPQFPPENEQLANCSKQFTNSAASFPAKSIKNHAISIIHHQNIMCPTLIFVARLSIINMQPRGVRHMRSHGSGGQKTCGLKKLQTNSFSRSAHAQNGQEKRTHLSTKNELKSN